MISLKQVKSSDFGGIYPLLQSFETKLDPDVWRRLFDIQWERSSHHCGYGLFDDDTPVGYLGMIFSQRWIDRQKHDFCHLTSWIMRPDYRSHSLSMMMPVMRLKNHTVVDLSASETVVKLSSRLGFQYLDQTIDVLFPDLRRGNHPSAETLHFYSGNEISPLQLSSADKKIFLDHLPYQNCCQLVLAVNQEYCHLAYTRSSDLGIPFAHIQFVSNVDLFRRYQAQICRRIARESRVHLIAIDTRLRSSQELTFSVQMPMKSPRLYRSEILKKEQIDNLYSEYVVLSLNTDLGIRQQILERFPMVKAVKNRLVVQRA